MTEEQEQRCEECGCVLHTISEIQQGLCNDCGEQLVKDIDGPPWINWEELAWDWPAMSLEEGCGA